MTFCYEILFWIRSVWDRELSVTSLSEAVVVVVEGIEVMRDLMTIESIFPKRHLRSLSLSLLSVKRRHRRSISSSESTSLIASNLWQLLKANSVDPCVWPLADDGFLANF